MLKSRKITVLRIEQLGEATRAGVTVALAERAVRAMYSEPLAPTTIGRIPPEPGSEPLQY